MNKMIPKTESTTHGPYRSASSWRYLVIKRYRNRAMYFRDHVETVQEKEAWDQVIKWFESILKTRYINENGSIGLPTSWIDEGEVSELGQKSEA